jgi:hypothetical protein
MVRLAWLPLNLFPLLPLVLPLSPPFPLSATADPLLGIIVRGLNFI